MGKGKTKIDEIIDDVVESVISHRSSNGKLLAKKFPELRGLSWKKFLIKLPIDLDLITASEMFDSLNSKKRGKTNENI